jgi:hypothetical protein
MKKVVFLTFFLFTSSIIAQLIDENFDYSTGTLTTVTANWSENPTGSTDIQILSGSLSYSSYPSSGVGNKINLNGGATGRSGVLRTFTTQSGNGTTVYCSFLLYVTSTSDMDINTSDGDYLANFQNSELSQIRSFIYVRQGSTSSKFSIGLAKSSSVSLTWHSTELDIETTYLIVIAYIFQSGDDAVKLWINPSLSGSEPSADVTITSGADASNINNIQFRQRAKSGDMDVDGVRVSTSWSQAPLPVELVSFTANVQKNKVHLNWITAMEINNYGFEIFRSTKYENWIKVGFITGFGNSNSQKNYTFIDEPLGGREFRYKLKQIDFDGQYDFSDEIIVSLDEINQFYLEQNYPNPFNPSTIISYQLPISGKVTLTIFDLLGREVEVLVNEYQESGFYKVNFNGSNLPSGTYFYNLVSGVYSETKKFLLIK